MQYESVFKAIDDILRNEAGCSNELDYIEQTSWLLFLKYLDDLEEEQEMKAELSGKRYKPIITGFNRWSSWAAPKKEGKLDVVNAMTGEDLVKFVNDKLFPGLAQYKNSASDTCTIEYKIGEIFSELRNKIQSGYNLREVINKIDELHFQSADDKHEMTVLYEDKIQRMGNAGRNGGEYYTPRPLIRSIVKVVNPRIGETVYDPACGSAGFLCEAFNYMQEQIASISDSEKLQRSTFYGKEKKPLPYIIATMNMIFHGVAAPNIYRGNTLTENLNSVQEKDRMDVILANPPFGGSEREEVQQNFDIRTSETAYMFMQHFVKMLKAGGRAGIVIKNTFLSNGDACALRKMLIEKCNLHTILDLPSGVFTGAGVKTVVLFFDKGTPTKRVWYYQVDKHFTKTAPLTEADMEDFLSKQKAQEESEHSWAIDVSDLDENYDLSVKNPNKVEEVDERTPGEILQVLKELNEENAALLKELEEAEDLFQASLKEMLTPKEGWEEKTLGEVATYRKEHTQDIDLRYVGLEHIESVTGRLIDTISAKDVLSSNFKFYKGDVLYGRLRPYLKKVIVADFDGCCSTEIFPIRALQVDSLFLKYWFLSDDTTERINSTCSGCRMPRGNMNEVLNFTIPLPPLSEQEEIVRYLDEAFAKIDVIKKNAEEMIAECDAMKQAMLRKVFE